MIAQLDPAAQNTIANWVMNQGPWFAMYLLVMYVIWRFGKAVFLWVGKLIDGVVANVLLPMKDAVIEHLKSVSTHFDGLATSMQKLGQTCDKVSEKLTDIDQKTTMLCEEYKGFVSESVDDRKEIHKRLDSIETKIQQMPRVPVP